MFSSTLTTVTLALSGAATALILWRALVDVVGHAFMNDPEEEG